MIVLVIDSAALIRVSFFQDVSACVQVFAMRTGICNAYRYLQCVGSTSKEAI
jgi:hypothetical protein